jgi:hypothetical protein
MQQRRAGLLPVGTRARGTLEERFWRFVEKGEGCWLWTGGSVNAKGYGQIQQGGKGSPHVSAHRLSYQIHKGEIPEGMVVMHSCDNPSCVNPDHLSVGTQSDNILDSFAKGRKVCVPPITRGADHHLAVLDEKTVRWIRSSGMSIRTMAQALGLPESTVGRAKRRQTWKHVE